MFGRLSAMFERGIWGARIGGVDFALKAPWCKVISDNYIVKDVRTLRLGKWVLVISSF
jgi:hypothetical protein